MTHPLPQAARAYIGRPFRHRARGPKYFDCAGLAIRASLDCGYLVPFDLAVYGREPHKDGLREAVQKNMGQPVTDGPLVGDVLLMRFDADPHHIAIVGDHPQGLSLIHAYAAAERVVEHFMDARWRSRIVEVYRWPVNY